MSIDVAAIVERARLAAAQGGSDGQVSGDDRERLKAIAAEFESMLLVQMLRDMRKAGAWDDGGETGDTFASLFETLDVEFASQLARAKGMGLKEELLRAFDRMQPVTPTTESAPAAAPAAGAPVATAPVGADLQVDPHTDAVRPEAFIRPISGAVTSDFGWRRDPFTRAMKFHQGVDMKAAYGQEVQAAAAGKVVFSGEAGGYGTSVVIEHADGTRTSYAHLSAALVRSGEEVGAGAPVGRAGRSGRATGTHLHFEVIGRDGRRMAPEQWENS